MPLLLDPLLLQENIIIKSVVYKAKLTLTSTSCETASFLTDTMAENWTDMVTMGNDTQILPRLIRVGDIYCNLLIGISVILAQCE